MLQRRHGTLCEHLWRKTHACVLRQRRDISTGTARWVASPVSACRPVAAGVLGISTSAFPVAGMCRFVCCARGGFLLCGGLSIVAVVFGAVFSPFSDVCEPCLTFLDIVLTFVDVEKLQRQQWLLLIT